MEATAKPELMEMQKPKPKKAIKSRKRKSNTPDSSETENSSPNKSSKKIVEEASPGLTDRLANQLTIDPPKSKFSSARRALTENSNFQLPGREKQFEELTSLINDTIKTKNSSSLYINGPPGELHSE